MIADTSFLIDLMKNDGGAHEKLEELEARKEPIKIPAMAVLELGIGIGAELSADERRAVRAILEPHPIVPMDDTIALRAGVRIGEGDASTLKKNKGDAAIGATAEIEGEPVLTRNVDDFERMGFETAEY
ncbi:PIN domain-containing protein [Natranaeroarchaeum aerophilus]|uniref:Ribonuclease VapC n=1 Tax=Natranaeroarchaeum aerophilus TaxID=2917711 RepID=A0AAE3FS94_9EURY|nr:PIN domain-containing protein [Natranaeroarchaeum aerophilus]MCL9814388.1 PIN domain-containing protein [Natranaeroarchaeum aerophilus]